MQNTWFCSDLHFGHNNIGKMRNGVNSEEENRKRIIEDWKKVVKRSDVVFVLGDASFKKEQLEEFKHLNGRKMLVRGNHDQCRTKDYLEYFEDVYGILKYKEFWLSHAPIHPDELRGKINLHGHVHNATVDDLRYFNCCPENLWPIHGSSLISLEQIRFKIQEKKMSAFYESRFC